MSIHQKALADITWADLEQLVADAVPEGPSLDYKRTLSHPDGEDPWIRGQGKIGRPARDELAREIVAFANAYGGTVLLGVDEGSGSSGLPERLAPLPNVIDLAERLHRAISDIVEPPMPGFLVVPIIGPAGDGSGAVALRVGASDAAPHGFGTPPATYVRRGASATPMTMRDLQAVFWDARTRRERIDSIRLKHSASLAAMVRSRAAGEMRDRNGNIVDRTQQGLCIRVSAIPQQAMAIDPMPIGDWRNRLRPSDRELGENVRTTFGDGQFHPGLSRTAHGIWSVDSGPSHWSFRDDGTVSVAGFMQGYGGRDSQDLNFHSPDWYSSLVAQVMVIADRMRRHAGRPDVPIEIDCEIVHDGTAQGGGQNALRWGSRDLGISLPHNLLGPFLLTARADFQAVFRRLEREIWFAFGVEEVEAVKVDFARVFARPV